MLQAIVVTQGQLAHELLKSAERVLGRPISARSVCLDWEASAEEDRDALLRAIGEFSVQDRFLILTDIPGATPHRIASELADAQVAVVAGVNLPMVVRLGCLSTDDERTPQQIADWIIDKGRKAVVGECNIRICKPQPESPQHETPLHENSECE